MENNPILLEAFRQGKDEALRTIFRTYYKRLCLFAGKITGNQEEGADIVAEVFIKLFKKQADFETALNIKAFLYISTRNACLDWLQLNKVRSRIFTSGNAQLHNLPEYNEEQPFWAPYEIEWLIKIRELVQTLPPKCRKIFIMHYYQHKKVNEIARELNIPPSAVSNQLKIGINKIRQLITLITFLLLLLTSLICFFIK